MKTRSLRSKKGKSRRFRMKRGGQKKDNGTAIIASQMGGATQAEMQALVTTMNNAATPFTAAQKAVVAAGGSAININVDVDSVKNSLNTYANALVNLESAVVAHAEAAAGHVVTATSEAAAGVALMQAVKSLHSAFLGAATGTDVEKAGLYHTILKNTNYDMPANPALNYDALDTANKQYKAAYDAAKSLYENEPGHGPGSYPLAYDSNLNVGSIIAKLAALP